MSGGASSPPEGRLGDFLVLDRIAVGGMAEVFRGRRADDPESPVVVLKRLLPHVAEEESGLAMFAEEARLGAYVQHPNVVRLLESGLHRDPPFLALEHVPGCDLLRLMRWLRREGRTLGVSLALHVVDALLCGLEAVHSAHDDAGRALRIVHRDVSPSNVLLSVDGAVKLGDFGIAKAKLRGGLPRNSGGAKGKLGYLAPEQVTGERYDQRADVFAAAVILAELLLGAPLFAGGSELAILLAIRDANVQPFTELALEAPLKERILAALSKDAARRPASAGAFRATLAPFCREPASALRMELAGLVQTASGAERAPSSLPAPTPAGRNDDELRRFRATTQKVPAQRYVVETSDGRQLGPWTFAQLVEQLTTGALGLEDQIALEGTAAVPLRQQPELVRHLPLSTMTPLTSESMAAAEPDIRRSLAKGGFVRALAETALGRRTGLWLCQHGGVRKEVYVHDGQPEYVASNLAGEMLGEYLCSRGVIRRGELDMALAVLPRFDGRLGETLSALGLVEPVTLVRHIEEQVREKLLDIFLWHAGTAEFYDGVEAPTNRFALDLDAWAMVDEGLARRLAEGREEERLRPRMLATLERVPQLPLAVQQGAIPKDLTALLEALRTPRPFQAVGQVFSPPRDSTRGYRLVLVALALELVRWVEE